MKKISLVLAIAFGAEDIFAAGGPRGRVPVVPALSTLYPRIGACLVQQPLREAENDN